MSTFELSHTPFEVGNVYIETEAATPHDLKRAILAHRVRVCGRASPSIFSVYSGMRKLGVAFRQHIERRVSVCKGGTCDETV